ncbi:DUF3883 domain-containing protein [Mycolicibacterium baixiangningiae]|uniref:DUF3883 domain-containing protein n=1 Tax=Mycolicibacterium baixiangningiae TaxID=2761578 RepID=UPI0018D06ED4|nr:DUF3883 domain-containing protein [Mycolicibacterium baixiangningiae]
MVNGVPWSEAENAATVASYLSMLKLELAGKPYTKTAENERLRMHLHNRTKGAVELKYQNVSAVLLEHGWRPINGYKPMRNVQASLRTEVERQLRADRELDDLMERVADTRPSLVSATVGVLQLTPPPSKVAGIAEWHPSKTGIKRDYAYRDEMNRKLGLAGELAVVAYEQARLRAVGLVTLADQIEHSAVSRGDGLGYDVKSFEEDGSDRFIEVKTTRLYVETPFFLSSNEVSASEGIGDQFYLYRIYQFGSKSAGLYELRGSLSKSCHLTPVTYSGGPRTESAELAS